MIDQITILKKVSESNTQQIINARILYLAKKYI